jgi:hypothetical protein
MATIKTLPGGAWSNLHGTQTATVTDHRGLSADVGAASFARFGAQATAIKGLLADLKVAARPLAIQGSSWSFSRIITPESAQGAWLETDEAGDLLVVGPADLASPSAPMPHLVMASGGAKLIALNAFAEAHGMSLRTSGSYCGQSVAGAIGSGVHGSVMSYGAIQNHVRGLLMVVSPTEAVWIEPGPHPILSDAAVAQMADRRVNDPELFGAALVHIGAMGVVVAALLELAPYYEIEVFRMMQALDDNAIAQLSAGEWRAFVGDLGLDRDPLFIEVILNPFMPTSPLRMMPGAQALITIYFMAPEPLVESSVKGWIPDQLRGGLDDILKLIARAIADHPDLLPTWTVAALAAEEFAKEVTPHGPLPPASWGTVHGAFIPHTIMGATPPLHNDSFAFPRERLAQALSLAHHAFVQSGGGHLVWTLRFVAQSAGTMAFTRFADTVVINMDGIRSDATNTAVAAIRQALDDNAVPYAQHWGKMGVMTPALIERQFGPSTDPATPLARWRAARAALVSDPAMRAIFANAAVCAWGLC